MTLLEDGRQLHLFRLPRRAAERVSRAQLRLLDQLTMSEGRPPRDVLTMVLRTLLRRRLVEREGNAPAVYRVTAYGNAVRSKGHASK
jgi:hypothetical protein